jgi:hypothetical protein
MGHNTENRKFPTSRALHREYNSSWSFQRAISPHNNVPQFITKLQQNVSLSFLDPKLYYIENSSVKNSLFIYNSGTLLDERHRYYRTKAIYVYRFLVTWLK